MPDDKRGARPSGPGSRPVASAARPPPQIKPSAAPGLSTLGDSDLPLPSDNRAGSSLKTLLPFSGAIAEWLEELKQAELPVEQLIQFHRLAFGMLAALVALQAMAPTAVPSLWWAYISQPLLLRMPSNALGGFWYFLGILLWLAYGAYHVTQGAVLRRTHSGWPWSPMRTLGFALFPLYNVYGSYVLFMEAARRLGHESEKEGRAGQAKTAVMGALALIGVTWGLQLASDLGVAEIPDVAFQVAGYVKAALELASLGLLFTLMQRAVHKIGEEGEVDREEGEADAMASPLSRGPSGPAPAFTLTVLAITAAGGLTVYELRKEALECPTGASLTTKLVGNGERALYCQKDGFPQGPWRVRKKTGSEEYTYSNGRIQGTYSAWYPDGTMKETGVLAEKKKVGPWTRWNEAGVKLEEVTYSDNQLEGRSLKFYPNGKTAEETTYSGGKPNGKFVAYHENGAKAEEGMYKSGVKVGHWTTWNPSGLVLEEKDYGAKGTNPVASGTPGTTGPATGTPGSPGSGQTPPPAPDLREVSEKRFFAGRSTEWWEDRLTRIKQRADQGDL
ncbi:MAG TPA: toxin-antitoxin system YwqK family antitoxin, partial [Myxococcales bacterium]|nr:toxin-antitoxin system YwqK family antitoxin [Myxococcales bacterium]